MGYKCLDCGNRSSKQFPLGKCPACDSFKVSSTQSEDLAVFPTKAKTSKEKKILLVLFWALFLYGLWDNYLSEWLAK